ncbi:MAG: SCO family protein [Gemmatimonadetes bacterium]|nr:SCO family protein [Gemmatimonadota bacterium]
MMSSRPVLRILALLALSLGACRSEPAPLHGMQFTPAEQAPALHLVDADGRPFDLAGERGRVVLVYFGYTHCPDICPQTLSDWAKARATLGDRADRVRFVFVSVDPERDTPAVSRAYARQFHPSFVGLTATAADLEALKPAWHFAVEKEETGSKAGYGISHPGQTYVIDAAGLVRELLTPDMHAATIAADLKALIQ